MSDSLAEMTARLGSTEGLVARAPRHGPAGMTDSGSRTSAGRLRTHSLIHLLIQSFNRF